jgi:hypothetical protein
MSYNRKELRDAVARVFGLWEGPSTGGSYSTLLDSVRLARFANDFFIGCEVYIESTDDNLAPIGETSFVTDFDRTTGTLTISPLFTAPASNCDFYQIYRWVTKEEIDRQLAVACAGVEIATTLTVKTDSVDYYISNLPGLSRRAQITGVWLRDNGDLKYPPQPVYGYQVEDAEGQLVLRLPARLTDTSDLLWLTYVGDEQYMLADTTYVNLPLELVKARACVPLLEQLMAQSDAGAGERWGQLLRYWAEKKLALERQRQPAAGKVQSYNWTARQTPFSRAEEVLNLTPNF